MNRMSDLLAAEYLIHRCANPQCPKCRARGRWYRRRAWRTHKNPNRRKTGRK